MSKKKMCYDVDENKQSATYTKVVRNDHHHVHHVMSQMSIQVHIKLEIMIHKIV